MIINQASSLPKVSVCVVTYNQANYVAQCLQSLIDQVTNFQFEIIVADDFSTDGTRTVISEFRERYPRLVRTILQPQNVGPYRNLLTAHKAAQGRYVAHIDGDDCAYPGKLQAQSDTLDADPNCTVVWHRMRVFNDSGSISVLNLPGVDHWPDGKVQLSELLRFGSVSYHSSTMYRASARKSHSLPWPALDWFFAVELLTSGYGRYLEEILGGYRYNPATGISRAGDGGVRIRWIYIEHLRYYLKHMPSHRTDIFVNCMLNALLDLVKRRPSWKGFLRMAFGIFSFSGLLQLPSALRRLRLINPKIL